jgi:hypothetical protein
MLPPPVNTDYITLMPISTARKKHNFFCHPSLFTTKSRDMLLQQLAVTCLCSCQCNGIICCGHHFWNTPSLHLRPLKGGRRAPKPATQSATPQQRHFFTPAQQGSAGQVGRSLDKVVEDDLVEVPATQVPVPAIGQHLQLPLLQRNHAHLQAGRPSDSELTQRPLVTQSLQ